MREWSRDIHNREKRVKQKSGNILDYEYYQYFKNDTSSNEYYESRKAELLRVIRLVINNELTEKQRECVLLVKADGMKQRDVAKTLGISDSTVSRHLKAAQKKFDAALVYYECGERVAFKLLD